MFKAAKTSATFCTALLLTATVLLALATSEARADLLDSREICLIMESTLVDLDMSMIAVHHGNDFGSGLNYVSRIEETGWQGRLWGSYGAREVDVYYTGSVTYVGGDDHRHDIAYTSEWFFDGETGTGSGSGVYTDPEFSFDVDLVNMSVSGSVSVSYGIATLTLSGSKDFDDHELTISGEASVIDLPLIGSAASAELALTYNQETGEYESTATARVLGGWFYEKTVTINDGSIRRPTNPPVPPAPPKRPDPPPVYPYVSPPYNPGFGGAGEPGFNNMAAWTVPEPATVSVLACGGLVVLLLRWRSR